MVGDFNVNLTPMSRLICPTHTLLPRKRIGLSQKRIRISDDEQKVLDCLTRNEIDIDGLEALVQVDEHEAGLC